MKYIFLCFFMFSGCYLFSQTDTSFIENEGSGRAFLDIVPELEIGFPLNDFRNGIDRSAMVGKGIGIFYRLKKHPVDIGLRFGDFSYDHLRRNFTDIDGVDLVQRIKNKIWVWYGAMRIEPELGLPFPIYFEPAVGWRRYYTKTYFREAFQTERFDQSTVHSEWGLVYGGAVGVKIILEKNYNTSLDIQLGFKQSPSGVYYIHNGNDEVLEYALDNLIRQRSDFNMLSFKIGFSLLGYGDY